MCVCVSECVWGLQPSSSLCEQREAPEQGSAQVEVMEGTGSDKMYREERGREAGRGGRVRQRVTGPDKYPHTQTTTTRDKRRSEQ